MQKIGMAKDLEANFKNDTLPSWKTLVHSRIIVVTGIRIH